MYSSWYFVHFVNCTRKHNLIRDNQKSIFFSVNAQQLSVCRSLLLLSTHIIQRHYITYMIWLNCFWSIFLLSRTSICNSSHKKIWKKATHSPVILHSSCKGGAFLAWNRSSYYFLQYWVHTNALALMMIWILPFQTEWEW